MMKPNNIKVQYLNELISIFKNNPDAIKINETAIWSNTGWSINNKWPGFEIYYLLDGSTKLKIEDKANLIQAGDIFFVDNSINNQCKSGKYTVFGLNYFIEQHEG